MGERHLQGQAGGGARDGPRRGGISSIMNMHQMLQVRAPLTPRLLIKLLLLLALVFPELQQEKGKQVKR